MLFIKTDCIFKFSVISEKNIFISIYIYCTTKKYVYIIRVCI